MLVEPAVSGTQFQVATLFRCCWELVPPDGLGALAWSGWEHAYGRCYGSETCNWWLGDLLVWRADPYLAQG